METSNFDATETQTEQLLEELEFNSSKTIESIQCTKSETTYLTCTSREQLFINESYEFKIKCEDDVEEKPASIDAGLNFLLKSNETSCASHQSTSNEFFTQLDYINNDDDKNVKKYQKNISCYDLAVLDPTDFEIFVDNFFQEDSKLKTTNYLSTRPNITDVVHLLSLQSVIITGGYSKDGCPIIVLPDKSNFQSIEESDYEKLIIYLTSVPSLFDIDLGFHIIIDRRKDKWAAVRFALQRISAFFPAIIQSVYVLRPEGLLQKAISEVSSKFSKDEYRFQVVVCSSADELQDFIDKSQLNEELGGSLHFSLHVWIQQRKSLEKFSCLTSQVSSELDSFIQKIRNHEFPMGLKACKELQANQINMYDALKERTLLVIKYGEILLSNFKVTLKNKEFSERMGNVSGLERLLVQLEETKDKFDELWKSHQTRWERCLMLRYFEENFQTLNLVLEGYLKTSAERTEMGDSIQAIQCLLKENCQFKQHCENDITKATDLIETGKVLNNSSDCVLEMITSKCDELQSKCNLILDQIYKRQIILEKNLVLMERVEKANQWCANGIELLESHQFDQFSYSTEDAEKKLKEIQLFIATASEFGLSDPNKFKQNFVESTTPETKALVSQVLQRINDVSIMCDKQIENLKKLTLQPNRPLQPVTPELAVPLQPSEGAPYLIRRKSNQESKTLHLKQGHVLKELLETEQIYVMEMKTILKGYRDAMHSKELKHLVPAQLQGKEDVLFGNLNELYNFHKHIFLKDLENCISTAELVALCFVQRRDNFYQLYSFYCQNIPRSEHLRETTADANQFLLECQKRLGHKLPLAAYLLKPVQRITKYQLLLKDLLRFSSESSCCKELQKALNCMLVVLKCVNDSMHQVSIIGFQNELSKQGELVLQDSFQVWSESKKDIRIRIKPQKRHIFLYQKCILFCKEISKSGQNKSMYQFKNHLNMSEIGLTETVRHDNKRFEIWLQGRQEVHTLQASSLQIKQQWVNEIKRVLLNQLEELKGERIKLDSLCQLQQTASPDDSTCLPLPPNEKLHCFNAVENLDGALSQNVVKEKNASCKEQDESCVWSSDCSNSEDELRCKEETCTPGAQYVALADYIAVGSSEVSIREGDLLELLKIGCAGWWFVRNIGDNIEGWTPAAYLELSKPHL